MSLKGHISRRAILNGAAAIGAGAFASSAGVRSASAAAENPIKVGHQCDLTGALADTGYWRQKTAEAAIRWINGLGGVGGRQLQLVTIDTESKVDVGILRLRQLIQDSKVDFVLGSQHGGVSIASNPIMLEQKTICVSQSRTDAVTGKAANPYIFRLQVDTALAAQAAAKPTIQSAGSNWSLIFADYVWGQNHRDAWKDQLQSAGATVSSILPIPVNTADPISFVSRIDRASSVIFIALLGPDMPRVLTALDQLGLGSKTKVLVDAGFGLTDMLKFGKQAEGMWSMDSATFELSDSDTPHQRNMRKFVGLDHAGREVGTNRSCMIGDVIPMWESLSFIKQNIEGSGWKSKDDNAAFIKRAEANPRYAQSDFFPQSEIFIRPEDHQAFRDYFLLRIEGGRIRMKARLPKEAGIYPAAINLLDK